MKKIRNFIVLAISVFLLVFLDQWTKNAAIVHLKGQPPFVLIPGVFELQYLENRGAAFGIFQNQTYFFVVSVILVLAAVTWCFLKLPKERKYRPLQILGTFIAAGAIGNIIDRIQYGFVIDFFYFSLIRFPIFNVADIYVTASVCILFLLILTFYRDDDFQFLKPGRSAGK